MEKVLSLSLEESNFTTAPPTAGATPVSTCTFLSQHVLLDAKNPMRLAARAPGVCASRASIALELFPLVS